MQGSWWDFNHGKYLDWHWRCWRMHKWCWRLFQRLVITTWKS
jgi:hypothetical protein